MSPLLLSVVQAFPYALGACAAVWGLLAMLGDLRGVDSTGQLILVLQIGGELAVLIGGARALRTGERLGAGLILFGLGTLAAFLVSRVLSPLDGVSLAPVGGLLGFWLVSSSPLSPVLIAGVLLWTAILAGPSLLQMELASLLLLLLAGLARPLIQASGPPGWAQTFLTFSLVLPAPLALGLWGPPSGTHSGNSGYFLLLIVASVIGYRWLCRARPAPDGSTRYGWGVAFLVLALPLSLLPRVGQSLTAWPPWLQVLTFSVTLLVCALAALLAARQVRETYRKLGH